MRRLSVLALLAAGLAHAADTVQEPPLHVGWTTDLVVETTLSVDAWTAPEGTEVPQTTTSFQWTGRIDWGEATATVTLVEGTEDGAPLAREQAVATLPAPYSSRLLFEPASPSHPVRTLMRLDLHRWTAPWPTGAVDLTQPVPVDIDVAGRVLPVFTGVIKSASGELVPRSVDGGVLVLDASMDVLTSGGMQKASLTGPVQVDLATGLVQGATLEGTTQVKVSPEESLWVGGTTRLHWSALSRFSTQNALRTGAFDGGVSVREADGFVMINEAVQHASPSVRSVLFVSGVHTVYRDDILPALALQLIPQDAALEEMRTQCRASLVQEWSEDADNACEQLSQHAPPPWKACEAALRMSHARFEEHRQACPVQADTTGTVEQQQLALAVAIAKARVGLPISQQGAHAYLEARGESHPATALDDLTAVWAAGAWAQP